MTSEQITTENLNFYRNRAAARGQRAITVKGNVAMDEGDR